MAKAIALSNELRLLAACGLESDDELGARIEVARNSRIDWHRFECLAIDHGVAGMAGARLVKAAPDAVPDEIAQTFRNSQRMQTAMHLTQSAEAASLTARLGVAGIESIILKGVALSHTLYAPNPQWRSASDIDLLIAQQDLLEADRLLRSAGYERVLPRQDLPTAGHDMLLHLANVFNYVSPANGMLVELHHRPTLNPYWLKTSFDELLAGSIVIETDSGPVRGLAGPLLLAYLCWHALGHVGYRLKWFCDIGLARRQMSTQDQIAALEYARRPVEMADAVLAVLSPTAGGPARDQGESVWQRDTLRIIQDMENVSAMPTRRSFRRLPEELANQMYLMNLTPSLRAKAYQILRTVCDPRDVYTLGLGRRAIPVYAALGPLLAAKRFLTSEKWKSEL